MTLPLGSPATLAPFGTGAVPTPNPPIVPEAWSRLLLQVFAFGVLTLYLLTFLRLWPWGAERFSAPLGVGARTPLIQYGGYLGVIILSGLAVLRGSPGRLLAPCMAYVPFVLIGVLSGIFAPGEADFVRPIGFWLIGVAGMVSIVRLLGVQWLYSAIALIALAALLGTAAICIAQPAANVYPDPRAIGGVAWAGLFWEKNSLGLVAASSILLALWWRGVPRWLPVLLFAVALFCLARASSSGAVVALAGALGASALGWGLCRMPFSPGARIVIFLLVITATIVAGVFALPLILEAAGRDATLTGRTDIWPVFLDRALMKPVLGWGPGTFTFPSYATSDLVTRFASFGNISSPHNVFIAVLGDSGVLGFLAFVVPLVYLTLVVPFRSGDTSGLFALAAGMLVIIHGFVESAAIFGFGINWIMLFLVLLRLHANDLPHDRAFRLPDGEQLFQINDMPDARLSPPAGGRIPVLGGTAWRS